MNEEVFIVMRDDELHWISFDNLTDDEVRHESWRSDFNWYSNIERFLRHWNGDDAPYDN